MEELRIETSNVNSMLMKLPIVNQQWQHYESNDVTIAIDFEMKKDIYKIHLQAEA